MRGEPLVKRFQPPTGAANPVGERRAFDLYALPGEDLRLAIERGVITIFAGDC